MAERVQPIYEEANDFIKKAIGLLVDEKQKTYFTNVTNSIVTASELIGDNEEKRVRLCDAAVKYANQLAFILFRAETLNDELAFDFRQLPTAEETGEEVRKYEDARQKRIDEVNDMHQVIVNEQKDLDIFTAVVAGMSKEEAEQKMAEYEERVKATQQ